MAESMVIPDEEAFDLRQILEMTKGRLSESRLRRWNTEHGISRQAGRRARLMFSYPAVFILQHGDMAALKLLQNGERTDPRVIRYLQAIGVSP